MQKIPVYRPSIGDKEKQYVNECLDSSWISSKGEFITRFEHAFASFTGSQHALTVANGTVALHLALLGAGIRPGDEVLVPTLTYIASVNAIKYCGAEPVFVDSLPDTWQMDPADVERRITPRTSAILVVHLYGLPAPLPELLRIAEAHGLAVLEDAAEAFGSSCKGRHVGTFGIASTFSFFGNKTITTGEGGMVVSNDAATDTLMRRLRGQGLASGREYWHDIIGFNYRMTNICAALGLAQLERANELIARKRAVAETYHRHLDGAHVAFQREPAGMTSSYWMVSVLLADGSTRARVRERLQASGVETRPLFPPVHTMPMYRRAGEAFPVAENLASRGISVPSYPDLTPGQIEYICRIIRTEA